MFLQVSVCPQGGCLPQCMVGYHTPPRVDTPLGADKTPPPPPPAADTPPQQTPPPPQDTATAADGAHPTWNAFLY